MDEEIKKAVEVLKLGGTILYPTDTIWGLGCDATNARAVDKVGKIKLRNEPKSLIVLVPDIESLKKYVEEIPEVCIDLVLSYADPLTVIYPNARNLPKNVTAADKSIGIRIPRNGFCLKLLQAFGKPIISTSANISGGKTALSFSNIAPEIKSAVDYVVNFDQKTISRHKPSTIVMLNSDGEIQILRN